MKKIYSLIKAAMTSDMNIFKIKQKKNNKKNLLPVLLSFFFMFAIWSNANMIFEKVASWHLQVFVIAIIVFFTSIMTIIEGVYKAGPLLFNCKDDQLLLSLPIKRSTVFFIRMFKFYVFELLFNSLFFIPLVVAYLRWAENLEWTFFLTSFVMLIVLPIIPVALSCIIGVITTSLSSRFKFKNLAQIVLTMAIILGIFYLSYNMDGVADYFAKHATSLNDLIMKIYYPAGMYVKLVTEFNVVDLLVFILINVFIFAVTTLVLSRFYFRINSRMKNVSTSKKVKIDNLIIKSKSKTSSLIKKELNTFFKTPVFIVNAGFSLVLFILFSIVLCVKFNDFLPMLTDPNGFDLSKETIMNNLSLLIFILISFTAFTTSITNSVISLEGKNINILKSLPVKVKDILMSKIYSCLVITTPVLLIGDIILFIRFKISILEAVLLLILSIITPLISHFIGLIINLKYPKLEYENSAEVVKQSISSFLSVIIGMLLLILSVVTISKLIEYLNSLNILLIFLAIYTLMDIILYLYLTKKSIKKFSKLTI